MQKLRTKLKTNLFTRILRHYSARREAHIYSRVAGPEKTYECKNGLLLNTRAVFEKNKSVTQV